MAGWGAKISFLQTLQQSTVAVKDISSGVEIFYGMGNHVKMVELRSRGIEKVGRHTARGSVEQRRQLRKADWRLHKLTAGAAAQDHLFDGVARCSRVR